jgi:hypothetical protein
MVSSGDRGYLNIYVAKLNPVIDLFFNLRVALNIFSLLRLLFILITITSFGFVNCQLYFICIGMKGDI